MNAPLSGLVLLNSAELSAVVGGITPIPFPVAPRFFPPMQRDEIERILFLLRKRQERESMWSEAAD